MATEAIAGSTYQLEIPLVSQSSTHIFQTSPTIASGDFKKTTVVSGGTVSALSNLDNLPTIDPSGSAQVKIILSASETTAAAAGGHINIYAADVAGAEWDSVFVRVEVEASTTNARGADIQSRLPSALVSGRIDASVGAMAANVLTAASIASDAITAAKIADGAIDAATFAAGAINAAAIAADAITAAKIATDAIDADAIAASAVTEIQSGLATPTNITAGTITTVTNVTNAPTVGDLTATMKTSVTTAATAATPVAASVTGAVGSVVGNVGGNVVGTVASVVGAVGSVAGNVGGNVVGSVASVTAGVTVTTNNDKTGYGLSSAAVQAVWDALTSALTTTGSIGKWILDKLDLAVSSRMATFTYTAPDNSTITTINANIGTAGAGLTAVASAANLATLTGYVDTEVAAIKAKTDNLPAAPAATGDIPSAASIATAVWGFVIASTYTAKEVLRLMVSVLTGKSSGGGTTTVVFRDIDDTKDRVVATVDVNGNRTSVIRDPS